MDDQGRADDGEKREIAHFIALRVQVTVGGDFGDDMKKKTED